ncbi:MAG: DivIVA domain-containing protein [Clostridiales bacterium]|nr:DivIVA domain-containing protein [Clostridiales bacterium]
MLRPEDIQNITFRRSTLGGYHPKDVDVFIDEVQRDFEQLQRENTELTKKVEQLSKEVEEYRASRWPQRRSWY